MCLYLYKLFTMRSTVTEEHTCTCIYKMVANISTDLSFHFIVYMYIPHPYMYNIPHPDFIYKYVQRKPIVKQEEIIV